MLTHRELGALLFALGEARERLLEDCGFSEEELDKLFLELESEFIGAK